MNDDIKIPWEKFLNPEILRNNLIIASLFITAFEMLKDTIIGRSRDFFIDGFDGNEWIINNNYKENVLNLNKSPLYASLEWLKHMNVIGNDDIEEFGNIKNTRNEIVHKMSSFISKSYTIDLLPLFSRIINLLYKIDKWWILNIEIPINPDFDNQNIDENEIIPGSIMIIRLLTDIALGTEEESRYYYNEFIKQKDI